MGLRFRKSIKILPFVRVNLSKKGISSVSIGGKGLTVNRGRRGTRITAGLPGSGLSYSKQLADQTTTPAGLPQQPPVRPSADLHAPARGLVRGFIIGLLVMLLLWWIF